MCFGCWREEELEGGGLIFMQQLLDTAIIFSLSRIICKDCREKFCTISIFIEVEVQKPSIYRRHDGMIYIGRRKKSCTTSAIILPFYKTRLEYNFVFFFDKRSLKYIIQINSKYYINSEELLGGLKMLLS